MAAEWVAEVVGAVQQWRKLVPTRSGEWRAQGRLLPRGEHLVLDVRDRTVSVDSFTEVCVGGERNPDREPAFPVDDLRLDDGVLTLTAPPGLADHCRTLWTRSLPSGRLVECLEQGLRSAGSAPLACALAERRLSGPPSATIPVAEGLRGAQVDAFRACLSPGVRLVWGPPGTGKTQVLARAIEELLRRGKRVLLVSSLNVAVDNALAAVLKRHAPAAGVAVRVGPAQVAEIAADPRVQLDLLARTKTKAVEDELQKAAENLRELDARAAEAERLQSKLADFDERAFRVAKERVDAERQRQEIEPLSQQAQAVVEQAKADVDARKVEFTKAQAADDALAPARVALEQSDTIAEKLAQLDREQSARRLERDTLAELSSSGSLFARRRHLRQVKEAGEAFTRFVAENGPRRDRLLRLRLAAREVIGTTQPADVEASAERLRQAAQAYEQAGQAFARARSQAAELTVRLLKAQNQGIPTTDDRRLVSRCLAEDLPGLQARWNALAGARIADEQERARLVKRHGALLERRRALRRDAEAELIKRARLVATTLARSRIHRVLSGETFDVVLVDEAGAATLAEVLLALCRARTTAVLFGDFLQLGPVLDRPVEAVIEKGDAIAEPLVRWVQATCFSHMGIESPANAAAQPGCVRLLHQFRFGSGLRAIANAVSYEVLRDAAEFPEVRTNAATELIMIDVSTIPDLALAHRGAGGGQWWAAGAVIARALAELHMPDGSVGVITPYRAQSNSTLAALQDRDLLTGVAVGTVHTAQGREYPTVIFDLVEDESARGWMAQARKEGRPFQVSGNRLFGVGLTRARDRLYLIVDGRAVRNTAGGPLRVLREAVGRGDVRRWSAAALLGLAEPPPESDDSTFAEVSELLRQLVTATDIHDERSFVAELQSRLNTARHSAWMWAPWVTNRAEQVIPLIREAVGRGVDVHVYIRPDKDQLMRKPPAQRWVPMLYASGATVIRSDMEHRKIVVVDERVVLLGSLNALSNKVGSTREVMITLEGRAFAQRLLAETQAMKTGTPRICASCRTDMYVWRSAGKKANWAWRCAKCGCSKPLDSDDRRTPAHR